MDYQFSFNAKQELIFLNNKPYFNEIGSLLMALIDTDWSVGLMQNEVMLHPAISYYLSKAETVEELKERINKLAATKKLALSLYETLIDEQRELYIDKLEEFQNKNDHLKMYYLIEEEAILMPIEKRNKKIYSAAKEFPYLFETNDFFTLLHQEFNFMFANKYIVRSCSYCGKFFLTRKTNQTYCKREIPFLKKSCSQLGPMKQWQSRRSEPDKLYWKYRTKIFNRNSSGKGSEKFNEWLSKTAEYKELARTNNITLEDLERVLAQAESEVYGI